MQTFFDFFYDKYGYYPYPDSGQMEAAKLYLAFGISPGSCTSAIIRGDKDDARSRAHPALKNEIGELGLLFYTSKIPESMTWFDHTYTVIREFLGQHVCDDPNWTGMENVREDQLAMMVLETPWIDEEYRKAVIKASTPAEIKIHNSNIVDD